LAWARKPGVPGAFYCYGWLREKLEGHRFDAICAGVQLFVERRLAEWVRRAIRQTHIHKVALSGGIFMNVKANQAIAALPETDGLFVYPSCGDESNAMGAAYGLYRKLKKPSDPEIEPLGPIEWGPESCEADIERALQAGGEGLIVQQPADIAAYAAGRLAQGEIVARFAGRAEFGARALGNRSILAHPGDPKAVRRINDQIKSRDFWMPFACSILKRRADDYLVNPKRIAAPYMMLTFPTTARSAEIEAGLHPYDRTCRPQIVDPEWNPEYHRLIEAFESLTGTGAVLNTSFNLHGEPIVNTPEEALDVLRRSGLRCLIVGDKWVEKQPD
jgi:carbamoyltransferase